MFSIRAHSVIDYFLAGILLLCPAFFGFSDLIDARNVFLALGVALIFYSLFTNHSYSIAKLVPLGVHMSFDVLLGVFLILAPSIFGYRALLTSGEALLHWVMGLAPIVLVVFTRTRSELERMELPSEERPKRVA